MRRGKFILRRLLILALLAALGAFLFFRAEKYYLKQSYPVKYTEIVEREARRNELPQSLLYAVIRTESSFRPNAQSGAGARGLMQITGETYDWIAFRLGEEGGDFDELYDAQTNIRYGAALLRLLLDEFSTTENTLCAYHAGRTRAKEWLADPEHAPDGENVINIPFGDTAHYVAKVVETQETYRRLYAME